MRFLHLGVNFKGLTAGPPLDVVPDRSEIEEMLNQAKDWFRYAPNCWIIYTAKSAKTWYEKLIEIPGIKHHSFFVCELNLANRGGWLPKSAWEWITERSPKTS